MKYCFLLLCIFFSLVVDAQDYRVVSRGNLYVRSGAGTEFDVIGKLASKDTVHVLKMEGTWAQVEFDGKQAYVSKKYIMPLRGTKQQSAEDFFSGLWGLFKQGPISYLPLLILLTLCFTLLVRWMFRDSLEIKWIVGSLGLVAIGVMELVFFFGYNGLLWFCFPDEVGWLWTVVNFFLYGFVLLNQLLLNLQVIREVCYESGYNLSVGVYSYVVAVILAIIFYLADVDMGGYLICGFLVAQGVQIVMNYFIIRHFWRASVVSILFLLGSVSLIASSVFFIGVVILLAIGLFILSIAGSGDRHYYVVYRY